LLFADRRSEINVKVVNTSDVTKIQILREHSKPIKHVSFDRSGTVLAASGTDGVVYFYSLSSEEPRLLRKVDGLIKNLESDAEASSKVVWHPTGTAFGAPTITRGAYFIQQLYRR
jgi:chromosome transmission fidelity protein 4